MKVSIATWNINSVRLRCESVLQYLHSNNIDVLCLQETKCINDAFPVKNFKQAGYEYIKINGQKSYNGVAIISRLPLEQAISHSFCGLDDSRYISAKLKIFNKEVTIHNFYVPAGGDEPDPDINTKFMHKLCFVKEMKEFFSQQNNYANILVGDLNIAPLEHDVWSHKQLLNVVSHTKLECDLLQDLYQSGEWIDVVRRKWPQPEKIYSWWSYRARDWQKSNRGRRLDHIWISKDLFDIGHDVSIHRHLRNLERPSDHVPICLDLYDF